MRPPCGEGGGLAGGHGDFTAGVKTVERSGRRSRAETTRVQGKEELKEVKVVEEVEEVDGLGRAEMSDGGKNGTDHQPTFLPPRSKGRREDTGMTEPRTK